MKKMIFGGLLFAMGMFGVIAMTTAVVGTEYGWAQGWINAIIENKALGPFILFGLLSFTGLAICAREAFRKENR